MEHDILSPRRLFQDYADKHQLSACLPDEDGNAGFDLGDGLVVLGFPQAGGIGLRAEVPLFAPMDGALARDLLKSNLGAVMQDGILFAYDPHSASFILSMRLGARRLTMPDFEAALARLAEASGKLGRLDTAEEQDTAPTVAPKEFA